MRESFNIKSGAHWKTRVFIGPGFFYTGVYRRWFWHKFLSGRRVFNPVFWWTGLVHEFSSAHKGFPRLFIGADFFRVFWRRAYLDDGLSQRTGFFLSVHELCSASSQRCTRFANGVFNSVRDCTRFFFMGFDKRGCPSTHAHVFYLVYYSLRYVHQRKTEGFQWCARDLWDECRPSKYKRLYFKPAANWLSIVWDSSVYEIFLSNTDNLAGFPYRKSCWCLWLWLPWS